MSDDGEEGELVFHDEIELGSGEAQQSFSRKRKGKPEVVQRYQRLSPFDEGQFQPRP